jgi:predicted Rossmann-fold nucleotide-binding protein
MEAANRGAADVEGGRSAGLCISLPFEEQANQYITPDLAFEFHYFFMRKYWFVFLSKCLVVFPGGFGTMDELLESLTLCQTGKLGRPLPIVLFGSEYWKQVLRLDVMLDWGTIGPGDLAFVHFVDTVDEATSVIVGALEQIEQGTWQAPAPRERIGRPSKEAG